MVEIVLGPCNVATEDDNRSRHPFVRAKQSDRLIYCGLRKLNVSIGASFDILQRWM